MSFPSIFDSSMLSCFKSCRQKFKKEYLDHWKPKEVSVHLHAGASYARGLEVARNAFYVEGLSADDSIAKGLTALLEAYGNFECPADSAKSAERMAGAFEFYFTQYPLTHEDAYPIELPGGRRGIEFSFAHPLPICNPDTGDPILYVGRMDAILHFCGGVFICDEKTTTQLGATWSRQWELRSQFTGYAWGCQQSGIRIDGAIVRGISILKTKYDTQQAVSYRPSWQVERWYNELLEWVEEAITCYKTNRWRYDLDGSCAEYGGCAFRSACSNQDETDWLETYFERREWNPLLRTETKL